MEECKKETIVHAGGAVVTISETENGCVNIQVCCCNASKEPEPTSTPEPTIEPR